MDPWLFSYQVVRRQQMIMLMYHKSTAYVCVCVCVRVRAYVQLFNDNMNMCMYSPVVSYISCACAIPCAG